MCRTREIRHLPQLEHPTSPSHHPHRPQLPNVPQIRGQVVQRTRQQLIMGLRPGALGSLATEVRRDLPEGTVQVNGGEGLPAVLEGALGDVFQAFSHTYPRAIEHWRQLEPPVCARHSKHLQRFEETSLRLFQATVQEQQMPVLLQVSPVGLPVLQGQAPEHAVRFIEEAPDIAKIFLRGVPGQLDGQLRTAAGIPGADRLHQTSGFSQRVQLHTLRTCVARHIACGGAPCATTDPSLPGFHLPSSPWCAGKIDTAKLSTQNRDPALHPYPPYRTCRPSGPLQSSSPPRAWTTPRLRCPRACTAARRRRPFSHQKASQ
mmetsp:Transcript_62202/g.166559  ORF Transcript_62202/g.166559 Transcript_62202/m.166559 type:complete len:318 (-) Transcript_62202:913-1866(-)